MCEQGILLNFYEKMLRIRRIEEALADRYTEWKMRCPMHLSIGQEAIAVGICQALTQNDMVFSNHRGHAHYLAKGGDLSALIAELYGKDTGCCGGRGGSMHLMDLPVGFMASTPIVGSTVPLAIGAAWGNQLQHKNALSVIFIGDGCFEEGVVHESMNFACLHQLPVIFVLENNLYSVYTPLSERQPERKIADIANAHGLHTWEGNGNLILEVAEIANQVVGQIQNHHAPHFVELSTYRWREHCGPNYDDDLNYRPLGELAKWQEHCPIKHAEKLLFELADDSKIQDLTSQIQGMEDAINKEIDAAFKFAEESDVPPLHSMGNFIYA